MILHVNEAKYLHDYVIWVKFNNGAAGEIDLQNELYGEMFESLKNIDNFMKFSIDPEMQTIVWENGADFAPEFLYENTKVLV
jgi:hypothetical protein